MKKIIVLGATGSIGTQTLDLLKNDRHSFSLEAISIGHQEDKIPAILRDFSEIKAVYILERSHLLYWQKRYPKIHFYAGEEEISTLIEKTPSDYVLNALVGFAGLKPTLTSLYLNRTVLLANKESLVVGGELIQKILDEGKGKIIPIDSEHVALAKCLLRLGNKPFQKMILTASGGAFRDYTREEIRTKKAREALKHPNWKMGKKITIDCATMFNKGFECIEAIHLFHIEPSQIEILLHKESYVHSAIKVDSSFYFAEIGEPDMHNAIHFALYGGLDTSGVVEVSSLKEIPGTHFSSFDPIRYPAVQLCINAYLKGGTALAILNASNEVAVYRYLNDEISIIGIEKAVKRALDLLPAKEALSYEDYKIADQRAREYVLALPQEELL